MGCLRQIVGESASLWQVQGKEGENFPRLGDRMMGCFGDSSNYRGCWDWERLEIPRREVRSCEERPALRAAGLSWTMDKRGEGESNEFIAERALKAMKNFFELFRLAMTKPL